MVGDGGMPFTEVTVGGSEGTASGDSTGDGAGLADVGDGDGAWSDPRGAVCEYEMIDGC